MSGRSMKRVVLNPRWPRCFSAPTPHLFPLSQFQSNSICTTTRKLQDLSRSKADIAPSFPPQHPRSPDEAPLPPINQIHELETPEPSPTPIDPSIRQMLPLLRAQSNHFITAHIYARPYLLTPGDTLRLPFHMSGVIPGDVLRLNRASIIGSRDYTLKGSPYLSERLFECRATVLGVEAEPMRVKEKTKRRQRRVKRVKSKHKYTILRISELKISPLEELEG
ncbi:MAG: hypothetical protein M1829_005617 [Trizodia sp. TS-e1964]|nr:MAG: hypothetical protein M1829_005617 [Trizodia sp. TS-e1964]